MKGNQFRTAGYETQSAYGQQLSTLDAIKFLVWVLLFLGGIIIDRWSLSCTNEPGPKGMLTLLAMVTMVMSTLVSVRQSVFVGPPESLLASIYLTASPWLCFAAETKQKRSLYYLGLVGVGILYILQPTIGTSIQFCFAAIVSKYLAGLKTRQIDFVSGSLMWLIPILGLVWNCLTRNKN